MEKASPVEMRKTLQIVDGLKHAMKEFAVMCTILIIMLMVVTSIEVVERHENTVEIGRNSQHLKANDNQISGNHDYIKELEARIAELEGVVFEGRAVK